MKLKICGLFREEDILTANACQPDYIGFVFAKKGWRTVSEAEAKHLKALLDPAIPAVGVFINETPEQVASLVNCGIIEIAQLHGGEDAAYIADLRSRLDASGCKNTQIWKAFKIRSLQDIAEANACTADQVVLDNGAGTGETFDWSLLSGMQRPFFLAGGLTVENIPEALCKAGETGYLYGLDVSSGAETDRKKDPGKMKNICAVVKETHAQGLQISYKEMEK